jgi:hypothetical protein
MVFCRADEANCLPDLITSDERQKVDAYVITNGPALLAKLKSLHMP